jgi:hypothetical protein
MSKRRTPPAPSPADSVLREILESDEYKAALRDRMLAGKATAAEIGLARSLGLAVKLNDGDDDARDAMKAMDLETSRLLSDLVRMSMQSPDSTRLRIIKAGTVVAVGYDQANPGPRPGIQTLADRLRRRDPVPEPTTDFPEPTDEDLMPR